MLAVARQTNGNLVAVGIDCANIWHVWTFSTLTETLHDHRTVSAAFEQNAYGKHWRFIRQIDNINVPFDLIPPFFGG